MTRTGRWLLVAVLALGGSACAVGAEDAARPIDDDRVPFGLLEPLPTTTSTTTTTTTPPGEPALTLRLFLVAENRLVQVMRTVDALDPATALAALTQGPTDDEAALGLSSRLDTPEAEPLVTGATVSGGVVVVDLSAAFAGLDSASQLLAIGQLVTTMTRLPGVGQVAFTLAGAPVEVPRADGTVTAERLVAEDYAALVET